ncbi:hypothetical protein JTB14_008369 [Gonioctena quinquepunctata]|nr:hypothetical protein JTB14_008369 [Gonioctena quinquepunctata]
MAFKIVALCAILAFANAGILSGVQVAPAVAYSAPAVAYSAPAVGYPAPALAYPAPAPAVAYSAAAPISYTAPALTSQSSNIYRSFGNLGQVSTYSKSIDTPFSSVRKSDVRVSNPGVSLLGVAYSAAPAVSHMNYVSGVVNYAF